MYCRNKVAKLFSESQATTLRRGFIEPNTLLHHKHGAKPNLALRHAHQTSEPFAVGYLALFLFWLIVTSS
jgi:hypothetical protein